MSNTLFRDLRFKVFQSGNPLFLYIGVNALIFVAAALLNMLFVISGQGPVIDRLVATYLALPAPFSLFPQRFYTLITSMFVHAGFFHVLFNMLWLYWMGRIFLDFLNNRQFHFVYWAGGIAGGILFLLAFNFIPFFASNTELAILLGASGAVMAIVVATATLVPDFTIRLLFFGDVKLKYLALVYIVLDLIGIASANAGGSIAHLGGALLGFLYIKSLKSGNDWSRLFKRKPKLRVVKNSQPKTAAAAQARHAERVRQEEIDAILDKILKSGYDKLSKEEKDTLFKAGKQQ
ncbi:rhomboid family intramembrane serine protease [Pedobacter yulinensis]|uniref:Rhomboid family intramembrane serine protease n=1 Tax=Pedobacter yulinensis TaxID=2126353 RepID=A0A2T3HNZ5_9SPHI|nr:rhomboid family intramembrane serine protease [Pedobacter yulinensis]PST84175.1 rhomboid family intramembrane serine protease [Pedobacter yulinensis]